MPPSNAIRWRAGASQPSATQQDHTVPRLPSKVGSRYPSGMQSNQPQVRDLGRAFRNMCHAVAIATASNARETVERLLLRIILQSPQSCSDSADLQKLLITQFGVDVPIEMINSSLDSLEMSGRVNRRDGRYFLTPNAAAAQQNAAQDISDLEKRVLNESTLKNPVFSSAKSAWRLAC